MPTRCFAGSYWFCLRLLLLAGLGSQAAARDDARAAERRWRAAVATEVGSQMQLLDLANAAIKTDLKQISLDAASAAATASRGRLPA